MYYSKLYPLCILLLLLCPILNYSQGFSPNPLIWDTPAGGTKTSSGSSVGFGSYSGGGFNFSGSQTWGTTDINGDGHPDLVITSVYNPTLFALVQFGAGSSPAWLVYPGNGSSFATNPITWSTPIGGQYSIVNGNYGYTNINGTSNGEPLSQSWSLSDMNGDALPDLLVTAAFNSGVGAIQQFGAGTNPIWKVYLNNGSGFSSAAQNWPTPVGGNYTASGTPVGYVSTSGFGCNSNPNCENWSFNDLNADGMPDLVITTQYSSSLNTQTQFNAGNNPYFKVYINKRIWICCNPSSMEHACWWQLQQFKHKFRLQLSFWYC